MGLILLVALTLLLPPIWGWGMHWIFAKWWPGQESDTSSHPAQESRLFPRDYQI